MCVCTCVVLIKQNALQVFYFAYIELKLNEIKRDKTLFIQLYRKPHWPAHDILVLIAYAQLAMLAYIIFCLSLHLHLNIVIIYGDLKSSLQYTHHRHHCAKYERPRQKDETGVSGMLYM